MGKTMGDTAPFKNILEVVVFLLPAALLLTLLALLLRRRNRKPSVGDDQLPDGGSIHGIASPLASSSSSAPTVEAPPPVAVESVDAITARIERAVADGERTSLSSLYFNLAAAHQRDGNASAQMSALRSAAGYGALHGPHSAHAAARLALGEAAHQAGDLTTACEQWQLARTAFLEGGDIEQHAHVEKRMRENGCPTDWVLTDF
jgi:hypothetical protein